MLYLPDHAARDALVGRMAGRGYAPVAARDPYWTRHGVTFAHPDGWGVVLAIG